MLRVVASLLLAGLVAIPAIADDERPDEATITKARTLTSAGASALGRRNHEAARQRFAAVLDIGQTAASNRYVRALERLRGLLAPNPGPERPEGDA